MRACAGSGARRAYLAQVPRAACVSYVLMRAMHAIRGAAERADSTDAARLPAVLHTLKRQGVTGAIAFGGEGNLRDPAFTIYRAGGRTWAVVGVLGGVGGVGASGNAAACVAAGVSGLSGGKAARLARFRESRERIERRIEMATSPGGRPMTTIPIHPAAGGAAHDEPLGILARRRIEAEIIKPIYEIMKREFGLERAQAVIAEAVRGAALDAGRAFAAKEPGGTSIASFVALQVLWEKDDALDVDVHRADDAHYDYDVRRCAYAQMYREMGLAEIGHLLSCARDSVFIEGYDARIALTRTRTLMQGGTHCDFRYRLAQPPRDGAADATHAAPGGLAGGMREARVRENEPAGQPEPAPGDRAGPSPESPPRSRTESRTEPGTEPGTASQASGDAPGIRRASSPTFDRRAVAASPAGEHTRPEAGDAAR
ncbi:L-2-amino-thiazoline-4-carboxylic acid hydrolase [Burkholderia pseudomallei]|uniref:L-2-amino-thiazoline-4-carboxylic acid hydrolase n=1 Tax=Burkholderia pseudomallei TaxID=28450 RepID=UPI0005729103|nr:L-2-amino-thiazoline-4-carboxylic acid hydrolase [Burkholderia pseudomallei]MBO2982524.1 L-2-amino-thiazoline-4-carboxylic acid hydrolase [Burkholderia pseudomallei]MBO7771030.1 L-2-amino-thiazoline-4-carboxylic acid hydrolase [Burkholderia pseudomallei]MBO7789760.1 L-2-amino-thiazoline-4-carboxylic acid hydrolase [Burkholderia pseudomallei]MBO7904962.1 L-2-amino-thiazoline-4-carboxylic acid hydrolase [Burkholderia pseudomallei]MBO7914755.1 L-2-amino-thiazoline-4-carboxylic acid hydrolase [